MKFRGHETFSIRKGWLHKGLREVQRDELIFVDRTTNPMDTLGIGANMVKSLRYWLQATGLTQEKRGVRGQHLTEFGELVLEKDPYLEELGTLWILHYNLATGKQQSTSWFYFFNKFNLSEFEKNDFTGMLGNWLKLQGSEVPMRSLDDDFNCIINTYLPRYKIAPDRVEPESNMECPLSELGLLNNNGPRSKLFQKTPAVRSTVDPLIALAMIVGNAEGKKEILLADLLNGENSIGRVLNLDIISLMDLLDAVQQTGYVNMIRTAGLDVLRIETELSFIECIRSYYNNLY